MIHYSEEKLNALRSYVSERQSEKRFRHTCGVEEEAAYIGRYYLPEQVDLLRAAAILHDMTKCVPDEEQIALCESLGIVLTEMDRLTPQTLHGKSAEEMIKRELPEFAIPEILQAVRVHTTGDKKMSLFDKIIFLSDYIEAGRPYPNCKRMREKFHALCENKRTEDLDSVICEVLLLTIEFLEKNHLPIAPATIEAYRSLVESNL